MSRVGRGALGTPLLQYSKVPLAQFQTPHIHTKTNDTQLPRPKSSHMLLKRALPLKEKVKELEESILRPHTATLSPKRRPLTRMRSRSTDHLPDLWDTNRSNALVNHSSIPASETDQQVDTKVRSTNSKFERHKNLPLRRMRSKSLDHLPDVDDHAKDYDHLTPPHQHTPAPMGRLFDTGGPSCPSHPKPHPHWIDSQPRNPTTRIEKTPQLSRSRTARSRDAPMLSSDAMRVSASESSLCVDPPFDKQCCSTSPPPPLPARPYTSGSYIPSAAWDAKGSMMPCLEPDEAVLTKAEVRLVRTAKAQDCVRKQEEDMQLKIIAWEQKKQDRMSAALQRKNDCDRQKFFLPLVVMLRAGAFCLHQVLQERTRDHPLRRVLLSLPVLMRLRAIRKARAANILRHVIREIGMLPKMKTSAHKLLCRIRALQRYTRSFIAKRQAAVEVLAVLWGQEEYDFLKTRLSELIDIRVSTGFNDLSCGAVLTSFRDGLSVQTGSWNRTEAKMKSLVTKTHGNGSRRGGGMVSESIFSEEYIRSLMCSERVRNEALLQIIKEKRKEHVRRNQRLRNELFFRTDFEVDDARMLLKGSLAPHASRAVLLNLQKYNPTSVITRKELRPLIVEAHAETTM